MNAQATTCHVMLAPRVRCDGPLASRFVNGETVPFCARCDRKRRGICIDCTERPVDGRPGMALRCEPCRLQLQRERYAAYRERRPKSMARKARNYYATHREDRVAYVKEYRAAMPEKTKKKARDYYARNKERVLARQKAHRATKVEEIREKDRLRRAGLTPPRTCLSCPTVLTGRKWRCDACVAVAKAEARAKIARRLGVAA